MSLDLVRKNSGSPFHLQRSMVDQGGAGGAYESGGFDPNNVYNNDAANAAIMSFGKIVGAGLAAAGKEKEKEKPKEKVLDPKTVKAEASKAFKVKEGSELLKDTRTTNALRNKEDALIFDKYNASKKIGKI
jgi:hypothetical protein